MEIIEFCRKFARMINNEIPKTIEKSHEFYKKIHQVNEKCHIHLVMKITEITE